MTMATQRTGQRAMKFHPKAPTPMETIYLRLRPDQLKWLDEQRHTTDIDRAEAIRQCIDYAMGAQDK